MPANPTNSLDLPYELRSEIWTFAAVAQIQHIAISLPRRLSRESAERRRQAFIGQDQIPLEETKPLMLSIRDLMKAAGYALKRTGSRHLSTVFLCQPSAEKHVLMLPVSAAHVSLIWRLVIIILI